SAQTVVPAAKPIAQRLRQLRLAGSRQSAKDDERLRQKSCDKTRDVGIRIDESRLSECCGELVTECGDKVRIHRSLREEVWKPGPQTKNETIGQLVEITERNGAVSRKRVGLRA